MNIDDFDSLLVLHRVNSKYLPTFINKLVPSYSGVRLPKRSLRGAAWSIDSLRFSEMSLELCICRQSLTNFYILLTVHLSIILVINQLNAKILVL